MKRDEDVVVQSYKHPDKTFGEIYKDDPSYLVWLVKESKAIDRNKKSAARILCQKPYHPPEDGETYDAEKCYLPEFGWECIKAVKSGTYPHPAI